MKPRMTDLEWNAALAPIAAEFDSETDAAPTIYLLYHQLLSIAWRERFAAAEMLATIAVAEARIDMMRDALTAASRRADEAETRALEAEADLKATQADHSRRCDEVVRLRLELAAARGEGGGIAPCSAP